MHDNEKKYLPVLLTYLQYISSLPEAAVCIPERGFGRFLDLRLGPLSRCDFIQFLLAIITPIGPNTFDDFHLARFLVLGFGLFGSTGILLINSR